MSRVDLPQLTKICSRSLNPPAPLAPPAAPEPPDDAVLTLQGSAAELAAWEAAGWALMAAGKVGVILLAGGQGTRLGSSAPKGCYDIGLPSHSTLFRLQAERILKAQHLAAAKAGGDSAGAAVIPWYIMTSPFTDAPTKEYFEENKNFGLDAT